MKRVLPIDLAFAENHSFSESVIIALLRKNELEGYPDRISTSGGIARVYPQIYEIKKVRKVLADLEEQGYLSERKRYIMGKYPIRIYKLTDKAIREYDFGMENYQ